MPGLGVAVESGCGRGKGSCGPVILSCGRCEGIYALCHAKSGAVEVNKNRFVGSVSGCLNWGLTTKKWKKSAGCAMKEEMCAVQRP